MEKKSQHKYTNKLINQTNPYLLQHAHNPVNWYPWGNEALGKAKEENKLILISIGYAACHWCHVMEHESFENEEIAKIMNENFICIKVDREERPDIDHIYMSAVQLLTGSGGWPLNCFALPDGRPVYGGTYFKTEQWKQILEGLAITYSQEKNRVLKAANEITDGINKHELISVKKPKLKFYETQIKALVKSWSIYFDSEWGGNKGAPKFPLPISLFFLMQWAYQSKDTLVQKHLKLTLDKIGNGGIYDHVGGGFARYSVDKMWKVPHFEKMLYDNGQLVSLYSMAYKLTKNNEYKRKVEQTLNFIQHDMTSEEGAFYSSIDADSEGVEGKFYLWDKRELETVLADDAPWYCEYYNVTTEGNWEGGNILWVTEPEEILDKYNFCISEFNAKLDSCNHKLLQERIKRIPPQLDDKVLTSWNAIMAIGFIDAYEAFGNENYLSVALESANFIKEHMLQSDGSLHRNYKNKNSTIAAFLDDYALSIQLFTKSYQNTFNEDWLLLAKKLTEYVLTHFYDSKSEMFFYTADNGEQLIARKMELTDNVIASSNSIMANNLFDLGKLFSMDEWVRISRQMLSNVAMNMEGNAPYYANWSILLSKFVFPFYEVVFAGPKAVEFQKQFSKSYSTNCIFAGAIKETKNSLALLKNRIQENETLVYVCQDRSCKLPVDSVEKAIALLK